MGVAEEIGGRIRALRDATGRPLEDLAAQIQLRSSEWSEIERGERSATSSELMRIAEALGVSPLAILKSASLLADLPIAARRNGGFGAEQVVIDRLSALAELSEVLSDAGLPVQRKLPETPEVDAGGGFVDSSAELARWARELLRLDELRPLHALELAQAIVTRLGIDVLLESLDSPTIGAAVTNREFPLIFVNSNQDPARLLFTLAHELGHVLADPQAQLMLDQSLKSSDPKERFANAFAAALLLPEDEVRERVKAGGINPEVLGGLLFDYGVSFATLVFRLHNLGIIDAAGRDRLQDIGWRGILSRLDTELSAELSASRRDVEYHLRPAHLLHRAIMGYKRGIISIRPVAGLLGVDSDDLLTNFKAAERLDQSPLGSADVEADSARYSGNPI